MLDNTWQGLRPGVSTEEHVVEALGPRGRIATQVFHGRAGPFTLLTYADRVVSVFLNRGVVALVLLGALADSGLPTSEQDWRRDLGAPELQLPSRHGKNHRLLLYAGKGLAAHVADGQVEVVELFTPRTPDEYLAQLYQKPPQWVD